ncbi:protein AKNAD1 [Orycteropus afer afer]|uniref:Protein AKNAD1 n=1 Tax=Orycteropus afer afer TaxID=1230840 RepID=A0A8B7AJP1_ORYAF|nr:protein AKNAD1 [Orycteropus afer afer]
MDEADFSKDTNYDDDIPQINICNDYNFTSNNDTFDVSHQIILTVDDPQEKATHNKTCRNADMAVILDKITENAVNKKHDKQCTIILHIPPNKENASKSNISDILLNHLSKEEFLKGQGIDCETLPETSNIDSFDETNIKNIILCYVKNSWPKEQTPEIDDQLNPKRDGEDNSKPSCSAVKMEENMSDLEEPVVAGCSSLQGNSNFLTQTKSPNDYQKSFQGLAPQKQQTEKSSSWNGFKYSQGQVQYWLPDFSKVAPRVKIPKNNIINKPLTVAKQAISSLNLRDKSALVQDILETMPSSNCVEKHQEQKKETVESSQQIQIEPAAHTHQELLTGIESETSLFKLSPASREDSSSSSNVFEEISKGKQMCQKLKEQTDQLKAKVQDFSKRIAQDSPYSQNRSQVLEKLQGHLELLEQEFLTTKEKHLTLQQGHKHESPAVSDFDPERKVEGEIFKLEMLLEDVKEKIDEHKYTSPPSLPVGSPSILDDLVSISSPPSKEIPKGHPTDPSEPPGTCGSEETGVTQPGPQEAPSKELHQLDPEIYLHWRSRDATAQDLLDQTSLRLSSVSREDPNNTAGEQERAESTVPSPSCAFCHRALERKQKMEKRGHRRISCGRFSITIQEKPWHLCSACSSEAGYGFYSDSGLQSNKCENCGAKIPNSRRVSSKELPKEFHYRYNTPVQNYLNYSERGAFVQLCFLDKNKSSSPSCSKPKKFCSQRANMKSPQDEQEPILEKKDLKTFRTYSADLATPSFRSHSHRVYGSKSLSDFRSTDNTEFEILHSALDQALRTATVLKETTDQMIKAIAEDLAKARRWRDRLKY